MVSGRRQAENHNGCAGTGCVSRQETYDYNNRLELARIQVGTATSNAANSCLVYNYYGSSVTNPPTSCAVTGQGGANNGNVAGYYYQDNSYTGLGHRMMIAGGAEESRKK